MGGPCRNITALCRKIAFFGLRAEILLARSQGLLDSRAGPFLGSVKKYWFFGEIFTSEMSSPWLDEVKVAGKSLLKMDKSMDINLVVQKLDSLARIAWTT